MFNLFFHRYIFIHVFRELVDGLVNIVLEYLMQKRFFAPEIIVDRYLRNIGFPGDVRDADSLRFPRISFLISAASNDEKKALSLSGMITFLFFSLDLIGKLSEKTEWLRNLSIFSLFRPGDIAGDSAETLKAALILSVIGLAAFLTGILIFKKRDLPL